MTTTHVFTVGDRVQTRYGNGTLLQVSAMERYPRVSVLLDGYPRRVVMQGAYSLELEPLTEGEQ